MCGDHIRHFATILVVYCTVKPMLAFLQSDNKAAKRIKLKPELLVDLHGSRSRLLNFQPLAPALARDFSSWCLSPILGFGIALTKWI